ncbi:MAG: hypothetical protein WAQ05_09220 [Rubrivivax sp.]
MAITVHPIPVCPFLQRLQTLPALKRWAEAVFTPLSMRFKNARRRVAPGPGLLG